jgi:hypothetical protein
MNPAPQQVPCGIHTGILFSRKRCGQPASINCGRCKTAICKQHLVPQDSGPFLCQRCDRYVNDRDHDWDYDDRRGGWRWRGRRSSDQDDVRPAAAGAGAAAGRQAAALDDDDKEGFAASDPAEAAALEAEEAPDSDFDAS